MVVVSAYENMRFYFTLFIFYVQFSILCFVLYFSLLVIISEIFSHMGAKHPNPINVQLDTQV